MKRILIGILALVMVLGVVGCSSSNEAEKYIGEWQCYKLETNSKTIVFSDYEAIIKMELTAEFANDGTYIIHYYVNGEEGAQYPQSGTYSVENGVIKLSDDGIGEIVNNELILSFDNGQVKQYFSK